MSEELIEMIVAEAEERMEKAVAHARHEFGSIRTGSNCAGAAGTP